MLLDDPPADGQPQPQPVGRRIDPVGVEVAVKDGLQQLRGDAAAGVRQQQRHLLGLHPDLQEYPAPFWGKLKGVGEKIQQQPLEPLPVHGDDVGALGATKLQRQPQQLRRQPGLAQHVPAEAHDVVVAELGADGLVQQGGVGEVVGQTQDPVVALAEDGGVHIQSLLLVPQLWRGDALQGAVDIVQGAAQLPGYLLQHLAQLPALLLFIHGHRTPPGC